MASGLTKATGVAAIGGCIPPSQLTSFMLQDFEISQEFEAKSTKWLNR